MLSDPAASKFRCMRTTLFVGRKHSDHRFPRRLGSARPIGKPETPRLTTDVAYFAIVRSRKLGNIDELIGWSRVKLSKLGDLFVGPVPSTLRMPPIRQHTQFLRLVSGADSRVATLLALTLPDLKIAPWEDVDSTRATWPNDE